MHYKRENVQDACQSSMDCQKIKKLWKPLVINSKILLFLAEIIQKSTICKKCKAASSSLTLLEKPNYRRGLGEEFIVRCTACYYENHFSSSRKVLPVNNTASKSKAQGWKIYDVNIWSVYSSLETGVGLSGLKTICDDLDLPQPVNKTPFNNISKVIHKSTSAVTKNY